MHFGKIQSQINELEVELEALQNFQGDNVKQALIKQIKEALERMLTCQWIKLAQKVHQQWLLDRDRSTKYFLLILNNKRARAKVYAIKDSSREWMDI